MTADSTPPVPLWRRVRVFMPALLGVVCGAFLIELVDSRSIRLAVMAALVLVYFAAEKTWTQRRISEPGEGASTS